MKHTKLIVACALAVCVLFLAFKPLSNVRSRAITCSTTATRIVLDDGFNSINCANLSANIVYFGGAPATVGSVTTAHGYPVCNSDSCAGVALGIDASEVYCLVATGTQEVRCIGGQ